MEVTEVRIRLMGERSEKLRAFCTITIDHEFVVRDVKIIDGHRGPFIAMPSRKMMDHCPECGSKNHLRSRFCNDCGHRLDQRRADRIRGGKARLYTDMAHPINAACRKKVQTSILKAYEEEVERSHRPGYVARDLDEDFFLEKPGGMPEKKSAAVSSGSLESRGEASHGSDQDSRNLRGAESQ